MIYFQININLCKLTKVLATKFISLLHIIDGKDSAEKYKRYFIGRVEKGLEKIKLLVRK